LDGGTAFAIGLVLVLVAANGFFVATEFAIVAARRSRLEQLASDGNASARAAQDLVRRLDAYVAACQLGITMASLGLGWLGEPAFAHLVEPPLERLVGSVAPAASHIVAVAVAFALITVLHIVLGEQVPKMMALQAPEGTTMWVARPMQLFYLLFRWPTTALEKLTNAILRMIGLQAAAGHERVHSVEELRMLVTGMQQAGVVEESEARIARRAFQFADLTAGALMTPRTELEAIPLDVDRDELLRRVRESSHSRLIVYEGDVDNVVGALHVRDLFGLLDLEPFDLTPLIRPVLTVPATKPADDLLEEMQRQRNYLAVVLDEFGGTAGIVTLENLIEGLIGRLGEEPSAGGDPTPIASVESDGSRVIEGLTRLDELEELADIELDPSLHEAVETVGGLIMAVLGRMPRVGDEVTVAGRTLRVERLDGRRVDLVRLLPPSTAATPPAA
jgi:putative hemolysin